MTVGRVVATEPWETGGSFQGWGPERAFSLPMSCPGTLIGDSGVRVRTSNGGLKLSYRRFRSVALTESKGTGKDTLIWNSSAKINRWCTRPERCRLCFNTCPAWLESKGETEELL